MAEEICVYSLRGLKAESVQGLFNISKSVLLKLLDNLFALLGKFILFY